MYLLYKLVVLATVLFLLDYTMTFVVCCFDSRFKGDLALFEENKLLVQHGLFFGFIVSTLSCGLMFGISYIVKRLEGYGAVSGVSFVAVALTLSFFCILKMYVVATNVYIYLVVW